MLTELGFTVLRQIPTSFLPGLLSGAYSLHGGVMRDAGGRIVAHLLTSGPADLMKTLVPGLDILSGLVGNGQLFALSRSVEQLQTSVGTIMQLSVAGTSLAGIGLVANVAGVAYLARRLDGIQSQIESLDKKLDDLKRAVVTHHFATLKGAMDSLRHAEQDDQLDRKRAMLLDAKRDFQAARHYYFERLRDAAVAEDFVALEECLNLAMIGSALTASELQMYEIAAGDFGEHVAGWTKQAREFVHQTVLAGGEARLMDVPTELLPASELVALLDFAEATDKGWRRIDRLRQLKQERDDVQEKEFIRNPWTKKPQAPLSRAALKAAMALRQKALVLEAQVEHLRFLAARRMSARTFAQEAKSELSRSGADALFLLPISSHAAPA